ncbi:MAG: transglycosylase [Deltaproteobacteria bacterium]|nr:transglycosylase [Deltaproteobacteria bacterium]
MRRKLPIILALAALPASVWGFCFQEAGEDYGIAPEILFNIAKVESGFNPAVVNKNRNGTYDYGLMQINSSWAKTLGPERWKALTDPCTSVRTGAWILSQCISRYGYTWQGIGCYNSRTPELNRKYARKIFKSMVKHRNELPVLLAAAKYKEPKPQEILTPWEEVFGHDSE